MKTLRPVAVLGGSRIPFCRQNTAYADVGNLGLSIRALGATVEKFGLQGQVLGEVIMGAVINIRRIGTSRAKPCCRRGCHR